MLCSTAAVAQQSKYASAVDFPMVLAGNVGELRTDAFHAGIDIKAAKGIGSPVFAIADGYVSRVGVSPWGYGNSIYVTHRDGAVSVYGHLDRFNKKIGDWVRNQQYAKKSFAVDLYPQAEQFPVKRGEQIAYLGNSGSSAGPHLHLEIRDPRTGFPQNIIAKGYYEVADEVKPTIKSIKLYEIEVVDGVEQHFLKHSSAPAEDLVFTLRGRGYLAYEVVDYKSGAGNTMGIYSLTQSVDGEQNFGFALDFVDYGKQRFMNTFVKYDDHRATKLDVIRAYVSPNNRLAIYNKVIDRGVLRATDMPLAVRTAIRDDGGNEQVVQLRIVKDSSAAMLPRPSGEVVRWNREFNYSIGNLSVNIPREALYDDDFIVCEEVSEGVYQIGSDKIPLHRAMTLVLAVPPHDKSDKMGFVNEKNGWIGGSYKDGRLTATTNRFGAFKTSLDTIAPRITVVDLAQKSAVLRFKITDNLSGIDKYHLTVNGKWELAEYDAKSNLLTHKIKRNQTPISYDIVLTVTDAKNNKSTFKRTVKW